MPQSDPDRFNEASVALTTDGRAILRRAMSGPAFTGRLLAEDVEELEKAEAKSAAELTFDLLPVAQTFARIPISDFRVGAVVRGTSGSLYFGGNLELAGQSLALTVHAEQAAACNAYMHEEPGIESITVTAAPCGHCRQFLEELSPDGKLIVMVKGKPAARLEELLPAAFGPKDLGILQRALPPKRLNITLPRGANDQATIAALSAASMSWAPYTKSYSGVAVRCTDGSLHTGSYIENAAFNPSLSPFEAAMVRLTLANKGFDKITEVTLVELEKSVVSQKLATEAALRAVRPGAKLHVVTGRLAG